MGTTEAAHKAANDVQAKYGQPISSDPTKTGNLVVPKSDATLTEMAPVVKNAWRDPASFNASGATAADVKNMADEGMIEQSDAARAYKLIVARHTNTRKVSP